jgi:hypothetical protein
MSECSIPFTPCPFIINEGDDLVRTLRWLQTKNGPAVNLTGYLAELWVKPNDPDGAEFLISSSGTTTAGTSITIDGANGIVTIFIGRSAIPGLKLTQGAQSRFDLTDAANIKSAQFRADFAFEAKYQSAV